MNFIAIDFETASNDRGDVCALGLVEVVDGQIINEKEWLIKPACGYIDSFNTYIHGITYEMVANKPEFSGIYEEVKALLSNKIVIAHNAGFDMSVLRKVCEYYDFPFPIFSYACTYQLAKKVINKPLISYSLPVLASMHDIALSHHNALSDAKACAHLALKFLNHTAKSSIIEVYEAHNMRLGQMNEFDYKASGNKRNRNVKTSKDILPDESQKDESNLFYGKKVAFTGTLSAMSRANAMQVVANIGGVPQDALNGETNFLVLGQQDFRVVGDSMKSRKVVKAEEMLGKGKSIELLSEEDFLNAFEN